MRNPKSEVCWEAAKPRQRSGKTPANFPRHVGKGILSLGQPGLGGRTFAGAPAVPLGVVVPGGMTRVIHFLLRQNNFFGTNRLRTDNPGTHQRHGYGMMARFSNHVVDGALPLTRLYPSSPDANINDLAFGPKSASSHRHLKPMTIAPWELEH